jgi:hypothetical protein
MHKKARLASRRTMKRGEAIVDWISGNSHQTIVLTSSRMIVVKPNIPGSAFGATVNSFELSLITSFEFAQRVGTSYLVITTAGLPTVEPTLNGPTSGYSLPNVVPVNDDVEAQRFTDSVNRTLRAGKRVCLPASRSEIEGSD